MSLLPIGDRVKRPRAPFSDVYFDERSVENGEVKR